MWEAIGYVASGLSLVAFLATCISLIYRSRIAREERLIRSAPETDRGRLVIAALEFFEVDTSKLTKSQQYDIVMEQLRQRLYRFNRTLGFSLLVLIMMLAISAYAIYTSQKTPSPKTVSELESLVSGYPTSGVSLDEDGSAVQLFSNGWLFSNFKKNDIYAVSRGPDGKWLRVREDYVKGSDECSVGLEDGLIRLGFCWLYKRPEFSEMRDIIGPPLAKETRALLQFQDYGDNLLVFGLPTTKPGVETGQFQTLAAVYLEGAIAENNGTSRSMYVSPANFKDNVYCSANWFAARKDRKLPPVIVDLVAKGDCQDATGPSQFFTGMFEVKLY